LENQRMSEDRVKDRRPRRQKRVNFPRGPWAAQGGRAPSTGGLSPIPEPSQQPDQATSGGENQRLPPPPRPGAPRPSLGRNQSRAGTYQVRGAAGHPPGTRQQGPLRPPKGSEFDRAVAAAYATLDYVVCLEAISLGNTSVSAADLLSAASLQATQHKGSAPSGKNQVGSDSTKRRPMRSTGVQTPRLVGVRQQPRSTQTLSSDVCRVHVGASCKEVFRVTGVVCDWDVTQWMSWSAELKGSADSTPHASPAPTGGEKEADASQNSEHPLRPIANRPGGHSSDSNPTGAGTGEDPLGIVSDKHDL